MSTPIHFMGKDYASVDDMPPNIRTIYDKAVEQGNLDEVYEALDEARTALQSVQSAGASHPWDSHPESGEIAVPAGFETVTGLGPADHVFLVERGGIIGYVLVLGTGLFLGVMGLLMAAAPVFAGISQGDAEAGAGMALAGLILLTVGGGLLLLGLWNFSSFWTGIQALVIYRDGFAFRKGRSISAWAWPEIVTIRSKEHLHTSRRSGYWASRTYILSRQNGEAIAVSNSQLQDIPRLIDIIKRRAFAVMLPPYQQAYQSGQPVSFGPVTVSQSNGLTADGKQFAWSDIANVEVKTGRLVISTKQDGQLTGVHNVRASKIPNIEILCQLIGINPWTIGLAYI